MDVARAPHSTPREEAAALAQQRIMESVAELLRQGEAAVTYDLVSRMSGVPQRTVYRYFEDKDALLGAFWRWVNARLEMPALPTTPDEIVEHIPLLFAAFDRDEALVRAMLHDPYGRTVRMAHAEARREKFRAALRPILGSVTARVGRQLLASITALCSASGWESMKDHWGLSGAAAAEAAQWAVRALLDAAMVSDGVSDARPRAPERRARRKSR